MLTAAAAIVMAVAAVAIARSDLIAKQTQNASASARGDVFSFRNDSALVFVAVVQSHYYN